MFIKFSLKLEREKKTRVYICLSRTVFKERCNTFIHVRGNIPVPLMRLVYKCVIVRKASVLVRTVYLYSGNKSREE